MIRVILFQDGYRYTSVCEFHLVSFFVSIYNFYQNNYNFFELCFKTDIFLNTHLLYILYCNSAVLLERYLHQKHNNNKNSY